MAVILSDPVEEAVRLLDRAEDDGVLLRAIGGIAVALCSPSLREAEPPRVFHDIDLASTRRESRRLAALLEGEGYEPHRRFNALAGTRLMFVDGERERRIDVFLDVMEMCHTLEFGTRLATATKTLSLADLLLTKLQVVELTERDVIDVAALLADNGVSDATPAGDGIEAERILEVCSRDWGWWRTVVGNLERLEELWARQPWTRGPDTDAAREQAARLREALEGAPKSVRWKARALIGERVPWHQDPEEVKA